MGLLSFTGGEYFSKLYQLNPQRDTALAAILIYSCGVYFWLRMLYIVGSLTIAGTIWGVLTSLITIIMGVLIFGEQLTCVQWIGVILAFTSSLLLL